MDKLIIVGAGGFGREVLQWAEHARAAGAPFEIKGFLDRKADALDGFDVSYPNLGPALDYQPEPDDRFLLAIGTSAVRMKLASELTARGWKFATLIHPTAIVGSRCEIGEGSIICPHCVVTTDVRMGRHVILNAHSTIGHDATVGDGCTISGHCDITGYVKLDEGVLMGTHASVTPGVKVGKYAVIGAGSVAIRNVQALATVIGVPAKRIVGFEPILNENWQPDQNAKE
jgi:sugar O-acyltransferase (sialic acid O-acetyltransferase NeuD family)